MEKQVWIQHLKSLEKNAIIAVTGPRRSPLCAAAFQDRRNPGFAAGFCLAVF